MPDDFPLWFRGETAAQPVWWSEKTGTLDCSADRPPEHQLATQIAFCARYDDEECEFEAIRFFYYGACDPFVTAQCHVPNRVLQELGVFLLPGNRQWDKLLSFSSSSFLKMLKSQGAIPGEAIESLKEELRQAGDAIGRDKTLSTILDQAETELAGFAMFKAAWRKAYRPTALDSRAVMQSLIPHVEHDDFLLRLVGMVGHEFPAGFLDSPGLRRAGARLARTSSSSRRSQSFISIPRCTRDWQIAYKHSARSHWLQPTRRCSPLP